MYTNRRPRTVRRPVADRGPAPAAARMALVAAALLLSAAPASAQEAPVVLRLTPQQGQSLTYRYEQDVDIDLPPEFGGSQAVRSRLVLEQTARGVRGDTLRYTTRVHEVSVDVNGGGDALDFSRFEGQAFDATMTRRGEIVRLRPQGQAPSGVEQIEESMRQVGFPLLPPAAVRVGESWTDTTRVEAGTMGVPADGDIVSVNRTTLERLTREGERTVAHLSVSTRFGFEPRRGGLAAMNVEVTGSARDTVRFDVTGGKYLDAGGRQNFVMDMSMPGSSGSLVVRATGRREASLVP